MTTADEDTRAWMAPIRTAFENGGRTGSYLVCLGTYRPDVVRMIAADLGLAFLDFRAAHMAPLGLGAAGVPLERILEVADEVGAERGIVMHNVEALLAARAAERRIEWLASFLARPSVRPVVVPLSIFCSEAPAGNARVVSIDPTSLPDEKLLMRLATR